MNLNYLKKLFSNFSFHLFLLLIPTTLLSQDLIERTKLNLPYQDANAVENRLYQSTQSIKFSNSSSFQAINLFSVGSSPIIQAESNLLPLEKVVFLDLEQAILTKIMASKVEFLSLSIPVESDKYIELELVRKNLVHPEFISKSSTGEFTTSEGVFYRGIVKGEPNSIVSLSMYPNKVRGLISDSNGNYEIGKMNGQNRYALFNDQNLTVTPYFNCDVEDEYLETVSTVIESQVNQAQFAPDSVDIYIECDYDMYTKFGSSKPAVETFVTGLMNEIATIYENEAIPIRVSEILVWESSDPYASISANTIALLNAFEAERKSYNGAFAMLFSTRAQVGGRAGVDRFCDNEAHGITLLTETSYQPYPTYSNWVNVTAHEIGHLFGSPHTHNCSWGPTSDKAIDDCVATEGGCGLVVTPTPTAEKGTIMSYCHTVPGSGFSLSKGFGTEPGALIRNRYQNAICQTTCSHLPTELTALPGPNCTPQTNPNFLNGGYAGLMSIIIGDNETSSSYTGADEAYYGGGGFIDFTDRCHKAFVLDEGQTYSVSLTTWFNDHNVKAWIDYNNNNQFDEPTELIFTINTSNNIDNLTSGNGSFTIAASATLDTYLKLRFIGDLGTVSGPCHNPTYGQCEDYAVYIKAAPAPCPNTLDVTSVAHNQTYQAANTLTSSVVIPSNNTVTFLAGQSITLDVGFETAPSPGFSFTAAIASCPTLQAPAVARHNNLSGNLTEQTDLSLYPNPASEFVTIDYQLGEVSTASIGLYDLAGKKLTDIIPIQSQGKGKYQQQFNVTNLQAGMYFILLQTETEQISQKLILVR